MTTDPKPKAKAAYAQKRRAGANRLKEKSIIAFATERTFRLLQWLSPGSRIGRRATDAYLGAWMLVGLCLVIVSNAFWNPAPSAPSRLPGALMLIVPCVAAVRILDIIQAVVNVGIFDHLGSESEQEVSHVVRSLVLLVWNFGELILWFGLAYLPWVFLQENLGFWSRFYFSGITQLTIGYGDLTPVGWGKAIAVMQGCLSWLVSVVIITRFVGALPSIRGAR